MAAHEEYTKTAQDTTPEPEDFNPEAQQAARAAVMELPLFPGLPLALKNATGFGPHVDMLQHFVYWFHPRHTTMGNRWTIYKTYVEWRVECGLARKQVDKGRAKLKDLGLITEKKGPHGRIFYRIDWVALAEILSLSPVGEQTEELEPENSLSPIGEQGSLSPIGEHANSGEYPGEYAEEETVNVSSSSQKRSLREKVEEEELETGVGTSEGATPTATEEDDSEDGGTLQAAYAQEGAEKLEGEDLLSEVREVLNPETNRYVRLYMQVPDGLNTLDNTKIISYSRMVEEHVGEKSGVVPRPAMLAPSAR